MSGKLKIPTLNTYYSYVGFVPVPTDEGRFTALVKVSTFWNNVCVTGLSSFSLKT